MQILFLFSLGSARRSPALRCMFLVAVRRERDGQELAQTGTLKEFLRKPEVDVARNIKGQEEGSVARKIALADSTRTPPPDYYLCLQVYMRGIGEQTPLIHSLCSWWSQFRSVPHGAPGSEIFCNQIRKPLQCFRFRNDPFLNATRLNDFTKQCVTDCLGKIDEGKRDLYGNK